MTMSITVEEATTSLLDLLERVVVGCRTTPYHDPTAPGDGNDIRSR